MKENEIFEGQKVVPITGTVNGTMSLGQLYGNKKEGSYYSCNPMFKGYMIVVDVRPSGGENACVVLCHPRGRNCGFGHRRSEWSCFGFTPEGLIPYVPNKNKIKYQKWRKEHGLS